MPRQTIIRRSLVMLFVLRSVAKLFTSDAVLVASSVNIPRSNAER